MIKLRSGMPTCRLLVAGFLILLMPNWHVERKTRKQTKPKTLCHVMTNSPVRSRTSGLGADSHSRVICVTWTLGMLGSTSGGGRRRGRGRGLKTSHVTTNVGESFAVPTFTEDSVFVIHSVGYDSKPQTQTRRLPFHHEKSNQLLCFNSPSEMYRKTKY